MKKTILKKSLVLATSALTLSTAFVGCTDYNTFTEGELKHLDDLKNYTDAFEKQFGKIDPNHDWGMNEEIGSIGAFSSLATRAPGDMSSNSSVLVNRNQWTEWNTESSKGPTGTRQETWSHDYGEVEMTVPNYKLDALGHDFHIPGYPHLNGLYYVADGNVLHRNGPFEAPTSGQIPAGDVTPYEIQYVSAWFRTHKNPESNVKLHLSDFFIQNVSCDYDQVAYNDLSTPYQTGWQMTGKNGANISTKEEAISHESYEEGVAYATNLSEPISYDLDNLGFQDIEGEWTHVNNFNRGNSNFSPEDNNSNPNREIKFVKSAGTEHFRCHPSWCTETDWIDSYVLVRLTWVETVKDPKSPYYKKYGDGVVKIPREGYYLAFDFHGEKQGQGGNQIVERDGYYSNWIVKITPAYFTPTGNSRRIFCEDLGGSLDFDFNDAVVDVAYERTKGSWDGADDAEFTPIISVQAAGGTMPIYVEKHENEKYELHKMLNADVKTPVNALVGGTTHVPAIYRGDPIKGNGSATPGKVKICVQNTNNNTHYQIGGTDADDLGNERSELLDDEGNSYDPKKPTLDGSTYNDKTQVAPRAFAVPTSVKWMQELKGIDGSYKYFKNWVENKEYKNTDLGGKRWYQITQNEERLYTSEFTTEKDNPTSAGGSEESISWTELYPDEDAATIVANVNANSYLKLNGYTGSDAIVTKLNNMNDNDRVTFVAVLSSSTLYNQANPATGFVPDANKLQAILVPADISGSAMSNNGHTFTTGTFSRFNIPTYVENSTEFPGEYTYTVQFSFAKSDILNSTHTTVNPETGKVDNPYHDYLLLYLKAGDNESGTGTNGTTNVTVRKWYVHY